MDATLQDHATPQQLVTYTFPPGGDHGGMLLGALERIESGGAIRILGVLSVAREAGSGELVAVSLRSDSPAGMIGKLISFRLESRARARETERALEGQSGEEIRALADALEPGAAVAAVLVEHTWAQVLGDAVARTGGAPLGNEFLDPASAGQAWAKLPQKLARRGSHG